MCVVRENIIINNNIITIFLLLLLNTTPTVYYYYNNSYSLEKQSIRRCGNDVAVMGHFATISQEYCAVAVSYLTVAHEKWFDMY